jgi:cell division protein FtsI (penicillin-binding protein 3)
MAQGVWLPRNVVRLEGDRKKALDVGRNRLLVTGAVFTVGFMVIAARLADLTLIDRISEPKLARPGISTEHPTGRANLVDRNGTLIATSLATASLSANPSVVLDPDRAAERLVRVLPDLEESEIATKLRLPRQFVWLKRHLTPDQQYEVNRLGIPGLNFNREQRRLYPMGQLAAHVVGFTDIDHRGIAGMEAYYDDELRSRTRPLELSLDIRVQHALHTALQDAVSEFSAIGAAGLVLDVTTGELIAMVSLPDFDPNRPTSIDPETMFNRTTLGVYEMGSTFKIFTTAQALDTGATTMRDGYDATHPIRVSRFLIRDYHAKRRWLSTPEIFMYSSNIGSAKMALDVGGDRQRTFMRQLGMLSRPPLQLHEVAAPLAPRVWRPVNTMTIAYGHGIAVTPVQLASGVAAVVNGGVFYPPTLIKRRPGEAIVGTRVLSPATSEKMRRLLRLVVVGGTGKNADAPGYMVGGKTGTAEKVSGRRYHRKSLLSSFVGAFPIHRPRYVVFAMIDEAKGTARTFGYATGGWVAAPVIKKVIERIAPILGVSPVDEESEPMRELMAVDIDADRPKEQRIAAH